MISRLSRAASDSKFVDISLSFRKNPNTKDVILIRNEDAIKKSLLNLVFTNKGERFFAPNIGSNIRNYLFELGAATSIIGLENTIKEVIENYEPRVRVRSVSSVFSDETNECQVNIIYTIVGSRNTPENLKFVLQSTKA